MRTLMALLLMVGSSTFAGGITYIGDSQSSGDGLLFSALRSTLESKGNLVSARAVCKSTINDYLNANSVGGGCVGKYVAYLDMNGGQPTFIAGPGHTDNITKLSARADTVVVQLGDNHLGDPTAGEKAMELANSIYRSGKKCVWIGPASVPERIRCEYKNPDGTSKIVDLDCKELREKKRAMSEALKQALGKTSCTFVNSFWATEKDPPYSCDCVHYTISEGYRKWANAIRSQLETALSPVKAPKLLDPRAAPG